MPDTCRNNNNVMVMTGECKFPQTWQPSKSKSELKNKFEILIQTPTVQFLYFKGNSGLPVSKFRNSFISFFGRFSSGID